MSRKHLVRTGALIVLVLLAAAILAGGCGSGDDKIEQARQQGYAEGVKAEQAKWSNDKLKLAQTYIKEQEDSQENLRQLLQGNILSITIDAINVDDAAAKGQIEITAHLTDGSTIKGVIDVIKIDSYWYTQQVTSTTTPAI